MSPNHSDASAAGADDTELVRLLGAGDSCAAQTLYRRHVGPLLRFAVAIGGCRQSAEDAVHDTFIELLRHPARFDPHRGSLSAYLFSIARHRMARIARSARRSVQLDLAEPSEHAATPHQQSQQYQSATQLQSGEDEGERAHTIEQVRAAILALPLLHREIIALCDLEELPYADVALILSCPLGTVRSRLHRARAHLARHLRAGPLEAAEPQRPVKTADAVPPRTGLTTSGDAAALTCRGSIP